MAKMSFLLEQVMVSCRKQKNQLKTFSKVLYKYIINRNKKIC